MGTHTSALAELYHYRHLLAGLTWRDLRVRYRQSFLGLSWAVLLPLTMMALFTVVFARAFAASASVDSQLPYALYAFAGLAPWTFFSSGLTGCVNSLVANRNLVTKVYFPRAVFPLSSIGSALVDFAIALAVLGLLIAFFHLTGRWTFAPSTAMLLFPAILLIQLTLMTGIGLFLAMANLFYRDVRQLFSVVIQLLMFISAVVIPVPSEPSWWGRLLVLNPLVPLMNAYRDCLLRGTWPESGPLLLAAGQALIGLVVGWVCFQRASRRFAEYI